MTFSTGVLSEHLDTPKLLIVPCVFTKLHKLQRADLGSDVMN